MRKPEGRHPGFVHQTRAGFHPAPAQSIVRFSRPRHLDRHHRLRVLKGRYGRARNLSRALSDTGGGYVGQAVHVGGHARSATVVAEGRIDLCGAPLDLCNLMLQPWGSACRRRPSPLPKGEVGSIAHRSGSPIQSNRTSKQHVEILGEEPSTRSRANPRVRRRPPTGHRPRQAVAIKPCHRGSDRLQTVLVSTETLSGLSHAARYIWNNCPSKRDSVSLFVRKQKWNRLMYQMRQ